MTYAEVFDPSRGHWDWLFEGPGLAVLLFGVGLAAAAIGKILSAILGPLK